jgi:hypothetical protein
LYGSRLPVGKLFNPRQETLQISDGKEQERELPLRLPLEQLICANARRRRLSLRHDLKIQRKDGDAFSIIPEPA